MEIRHAGAQQHHQRQAHASQVERIFRFPRTVGGEGIREGEEFSAAGKKRHVVARSSLAPQASRRVDGSGRFDGR